MSFLAQGHLYVYKSHVWESFIECGFIVCLQGAALIRMLANVTGHPVFQRGHNVSQ